MPSFAHTPYDGSRRPFSIGLAPLDPARWIEPDELLAAELAEKDWLFAERRAAVFAAEPGTEAAQREALRALADYLRSRHGDAVLPAPRGLAVGGRAVPLEGDDPPLLAAARLVQDDLVLMRRDDGGWRLVAAALCFPSSWSLAEKFGLGLDAIHAAVPGYDAMAARMNRIFDNLKPGLPVWRLNWSIYPDERLHHPESKQLDRHWFERPDTPAFVRVERQTLTRLPESGDILFTIRVLVDPISGFAAHPDGPRLAEGLRAQLMALDPAQLAYKALSGHRDALAARLAALAGPG